MPNTKNSDSLKAVIFSVMAGLLICTTFSFAQGTTTNSGEKITWHNRGNDKATGGLEIFAEPVSADVYLDGKLAGSTPLTLDKIETGRYEVRVKAEGYGDYRTYIEIIHDKLLVVNATLSRAHHIAWQQSRRAAIQSSLLFPGKGQVDLGFTRGWTYFFGFAAAGWYAYSRWHKNEDERKIFYKAQTAYSNADNTESAAWEYNNMMNARADMHMHQTQYEYALFAMGSVWVINIIDVLFIAGREPVIDAFGKNVKIIPEITPTHLSLKILY